VAIRRAWDAHSRGVVDAFLRAMDWDDYALDHNSLFLDTEEANEHWGPIQESHGEKIPECCLGRAPSGQASCRRYELGTPELGE